MNRTRARLVKELTIVIVTETYAKMAENARLSWSLQMVTYIFGFIAGCFIGNRL